MLIIWIIQIFINHSYFDKCNFDKDFIKIMFLISLITTFIVLAGLPSLIYWSGQLSTAYKIDNSSTKEQ